MTSERVFTSSTITNQQQQELLQCTTCGESDAVPFLVAPDRFHSRKTLYQLLRCQACSMVWLSSAPRPQEMVEHYGPDYDKKIAAAGETSPDRWRDRTGVLTQYKQEGTLLDLGCSSGSFLSTLKGNAWDLYGIEMSTESASRAQERCGAKVFVGDILDAPFEPGSFDAITCFHVFEHLYHPREVLQKVARWLKPGGIFYVLVPNIDSAGERVFQSYWYALELPRHLSHFSPKSLSAVAASVGLEKLSLTTHREVFIEYSTHYILDDILAKLGIARTSLAASGPASLGRKVIRKVYRLTVQPLLTGLISLAGDGESIHAIFRKPVEGTQAGSHASSARVSQSGVVHL
ncbi:MAG: class I SAM-dependent methyltransferase [Acidobacteriia bacterium]|nr:class I SAM-dependent methyltransferase [Terriglobia bacterium]